MTDPQRPRVGVVGLGTIGGAMATNLARAGFPLVAWNRTPGRTGEVEALGATVAPSPGALAAAVDIVLACVSDTPDVEEVLLGPVGVLMGAAPGTLVIDASTIDPAATRTMAARLAERGIDFIDAPVTGGSEGARAATLAILVGGDPAHVERARPVLATIGRTITHVGPVGAGQAAKAINQVILAGTYAGVAEGLVLAARAGLDPAQVAEALGGGAAQSWVLANRSERMIADDYPLGFRVSLHLKDLRIALELARRAGMTLPVAELVAGLETDLVAAGHGDDDVSALARAVRTLATDGG
jgi:3-hydroxyisobutyrate dehydrogenase